MRATCSIFVYSVVYNTLSGLAQCCMCSRAAHPILISAEQGLADVAVCGIRIVQRHCLAADWAVPGL